jgi:hypothetical protein
VPPPEHTLGHYLFSQEANPQPKISKDATEKHVARTVACHPSGMKKYELCDHSAINFSGQPVVIPRISPVQLAGSVRKSSKQRVYSSYT